MSTQSHRSRTLLGLIVVALLAPRALYAHTVGLSRGDYRLDGNTVVATIIFARPELASSVPEIDLDRDGTISASELQASTHLLARTIGGGIEVREPAGRCSGTEATNAGLMEEDGVSLEIRFECHDRPEAVSITLPFLELMSQGHRHLAGVGTQPSEARIVAYRGHGEFRVARGSTTAETSGAVWGLFRLGVEHILTGYDHLVFLCGLILIGGRLRSLLFIVTAFTVAHSITLGVSALGIWSPSSFFVEPAIALSIAYIGLENWFISSVDKRWLITFPFGLIHGFGFAGALGEISLPPSQVPLALALFNGGVEAGQVAVLLLVLPMLAWLRRHEWFADRGVKAISGAIAAAGVWWFVVRIV